MHTVKVKSILSASNGMNLYRGCQHGCIYCDSRSLCYRMDHDFEDIEVKENALVLLEKALRSKRRRCVIGTGSMCDPYIPLENQLMLTRRSFELIEKYNFGVSLLTKSCGILRDIDLLKRIHENAGAVVQMTITTWDDDLCRMIEPNVSVTSERITALHAFRNAGIPTVVWLCPILPFINDEEENLTAILAACRNADVKGIVNFGMGVTLRDGSREYFYHQLDCHFPGMKERYIHNFGNAYELPSPNSGQLLRLFHERCEEYGILHDNDEIFRFVSELKEKEEQITIF